MKHQRDSECKQLEICICEEGRKCERNTEKWTKRTTEPSSLRDEERTLPSSIMSISFLSFSFAVDVSSDSCDKVLLRKKNVWEGLMGETKDCFLSSPNNVTRHNADVTLSKGMLKCLQARHWSPNCPWCLFIRVCMTVRKCLRHRIKLCMNNVVNMASSPQCFECSVRVRVEKCYKQYQGYT